MNRFKIAGSVALLSAIVFLSGCNSSIVRYEQTIKLDRTGNLTVSRQVSAPKKDQIVRVEVSAGEPIDVEVVLASNRGKGKPAAKGTSVKRFNENVRVPANESFFITVSLATGSKATDVLLKANSVE